MANRVKRCTDCQPCKQGCCCEHIRFTVCADFLEECTPPTQLPPFPPNCLPISNLYFGWEDVPQCILDMANGNPVVYDIFLGQCPTDMSGTPDFTVTNPVAVTCGNIAFALGRATWAGLAATDCGICLPDVCLRVSAGGVLLTRCTVCPELCDQQCSSSSSSSSGSSESSSSASSDSSGSSSSSGSSESSGSSSSSSEESPSSSSSSSSSGSSESESSSSSSSSSESSGSESSYSSQSSESSSSGSESSSSSGGEESSSSSSSGGGCTCTLTLEAFYDPVEERIFGTLRIDCGCPCSEAGETTVFDDLGNADGSENACDSTWSWQLPAFYPPGTGIVQISASFDACAMQCQTSVIVIVP